MRLIWNNAAQLAEEAREQEQSTGHSDCNSDLGISLVINRK